MEDVIYSYQCHDIHIEKCFVKILQIVKDHHYVGYFPLETLGPGDPIEKLKILKQKVTEAFEKVFS